MSQQLRDAASILLALHDPKQHQFPHQAAAWQALRSALADVAEFTALGTGVTEIRELKAQIAAHDSRVCGSCGERLKRERGEAGQL